MELNQKNQSISLAQVNNNSDKSKVWEIANKSQMKSANRIHLEGKNQNSKEIIEKFTEGLNREKNRMNSKADTNLLKNKPISDNGMKNSNQQLKSNANSELINNLKHIKKFSQNLTNQKNNVKFESKPNLIQNDKISTHSNKSENKSNLINPLLNEKKLIKTEERNSNTLSKKEIKVLELGHDKIVHEVDKDQQNKNKENPNKEYKLEMDSSQKAVKDHNRNESIENNKIDINYNEDGQLDSEFQDSNENFKESLLHLINHFNTKIKGEINGDKMGEFEINTEFGKLSVKIQKHKNHITIDINSDLIYELEGQLGNIENSILEKIPEIDSITINTTHLSFDYEPLKKIPQENKKANVMQDSLFKLNFLA